MVEISSPEALIPRFKTDKLLNQGGAATSSIFHILMNL